MQAAFFVGISQTASVAKLAVAELSNVEKELTPTYAWRILPPAHSPANTPASPSATLPQT